jgi:hypothetical protein
MMRGAHRITVKSFKQALQIARSAGEDAANRRMRKAGRRRWSAADYDCAVNVTRRVLSQLGYDLAAVEERLAS